MRFGYFLNQNNWGLTKPFHEVVNEGREIAQYCDQNGWESIWTTEHHFGHEGLEVCPNPVLMCVDLAAHTERIRLGQAANIITFRHPVQMAEDLAMLDHMSAGRLEVGVGRGVYPRETVNMNPVADVRNPAVNRSLFEETLEVIRHFNKADIALYQHYSKKLDSEIELNGGLKKELLHFKCFNNLFRLQNNAKSEISRHIPYHYKVKLKQMWSR